MSQQHRFNEDAASHLAQALMAYGHRQRNPVLDVIPENGSYKVNTKYPENRLKFGDDCWRAYYHSHESPQSGSEHGHFHLFFRIDSRGNIEKDWSHVVALGMDNDGQPVRWFTVNNWVTGDRWLEADDLVEKLSFTIDESEPVAYWLSSMLGFYQWAIRDLLLSRDRKLDSLRGPQERKEALKNRDIYFLSHSPVSLLQDLAIVLDQGIA